MSESSVSIRRCFCGIDVLHLTAWTPHSAGRRFTSVHKVGHEKCDFWDWEKPRFPLRAVELIYDLKSKEKSLRSEKIFLLKKIANFKCSNNMLEEKIMELECSTVEVVRPPTVVAGLPANLRFQLLSYFSLSCFVGDN
ncbi:uncharacterized protein LOC132040187 [Lycium ferocissimum]|uniref:uncharacterized protein LOC132040187 n=1 Tax=Lycium ferocissimum TaxID=112874 RepID=UPI002816216E|nr:uncharacterized protein LOC132040187 [Lycium ferocissimum]XP_059286792.1 uncharacterized protein LOC132040187 [Lycium ferocissimum]